VRVIVLGTAAAVEKRSYEGKNGTVTVADVFVGTAPYFDKVTMALDLIPAVGEQVAYLANVKAKSITSKRDGQTFTILDVWCVERLSPAEVPASIPEAHVRAV